MIQEEKEEKEDSKEEKSYFERRIILPLTTYEAIQEVAKQENLPVKALANKYIREGIANRERILKAVQEKAIKA